MRFAATRRLSTAALNAARMGVDAQQLTSWRRSQGLISPAAQSTLRAGRTRLHDARDTEFVLKLFGTATDDAAAILDSCERFVEDWHHVDGILDRNPPKLVPASESSTGRTSVKSHELTREWINAYKEQGFAQLSELGLPFTIQCAAQYTLGGAASSNLVGYFVLTRCAADLLEAHDCSVKELYLPSLRSAEAFGTMALSEPHAGSSLSSIRTMATRSAGDDSYRLRGDKMWTTGAFQDVSSNIVQMVLARTPNAKPGAAGISLFCVPNVLPDGTHNDVELISLNKKMGHRAITNCAWSLGSGGEGAIGYLVGKEGEGLRCMFGMMNAMRIEVGLGAACLGKRGYLESLCYAQEREQGGKPIIEHADVKRMLMLQKAYSEGAYALCMQAASLHDKATEGDKDAAKLLGLQTEIVKSWPSEWCLEANNLAIQVLGGAGYVQDYPVEQLYRDNRLNMIHEGTAGIHALTLLGRKVQKGQAAPLFKAMMEAADEADALLASEEGRHLSSSEWQIEECARMLREAVSRAAAVTDQLTADGMDKRQALTNAHDYLTLMGHTCVAWMWLRSATEAGRGLRVAIAAGDAEEEAFYCGKLHTCAFFFQYVLPETEPLAKRLVAPDGGVTLESMRSEWF